MFEEVFQKGSEIEVFVEEINDTRISLNWDKKIEPNHKLYNDIYKIFQNLVTSWICWGEGRAERSNSQRPNK